MALPDRSKEVTKEQIVADLKKLHVEPGDLLNIKISLKSIGYVEGGAKTVVDALLEAIGPDGTIVADSFVDIYRMPLSEENIAKVSDRWTPSYAGAIANEMIKYPGSFRSSHPVQKFVAIGAQAEELTRNHTPESYAYDVLRVMSETGGRNLRIGGDEKVVGVGTTHVAIGLLKLHQNRPRAGVYYRTESGEVAFFERNWSGGCAEGFSNFYPLHRDAGAIIANGKVGYAESRLTDMKTTLDVELETLSKDPSFFFCDNPACYNCRISWDFSTGSLIKVRFYQLLDRIRKKLN